MTNLASAVPLLWPRRFTTVTPGAPGGGVWSGVGPAVPDHAFGSHVQSMSCQVRKGSTLHPMVVPWATPHGITPTRPDLASHHRAAAAAPPPGPASPAPGPRPGPWREDESGHGAGAATGRSSGSRQGAGGLLVAHGSGAVLVLYWCASVREGLWRIGGQEPGQPDYGIHLAKK